MARTVEDTDVVFETLSPRGDLAGRLEGVVDQLIKLAGAAGVRLGVLGGASSVHVSEGGPRYFDVNPPPPEVRPEVETGLALLEALQQAPENLDWFYVSPAADLRGLAAAAGHRAYRISDDVLLTDENGDSYIAAPDLALAVLDEIEQPRHHRRRFHVAL